MLPPKLDYAAASLLPSQTPTALKARLDGERAVAERDRADGDSPPRFHDPAGPSATEQAAAAVGERLERLLPEETPREIEPLEETPAEGEATEVDSAEASAEENSDRAPSVAADAAFADLLRRRPRPPPRRRIPTIALVFLAVAGVALLFGGDPLGFSSLTAPALLAAGSFSAGGLGSAGVVSTWPSRLAGLVARFSGRSGRRLHQSRGASRTGARGMVQPPAMSREAVMDFGLGETVEAIRETTARFAADHIAPLAAAIDETNTFPRQLWPAMGALGLHGITVEEEAFGRPRPRLSSSTWWRWRRSPAPPLPSA